MYNVIEIGGFRVHYRHRDTENVIKVAKIEFGWEEIDVPKGLDECDGYTFYSLLKILDESGANPEVAEVKMVKFD